MSLINDALKRAKQAQHENPAPTPPLEFRPVDPAQEGGARPALLFVSLTLALIAVVALGGLAAWFVVQKNQTELRVEAKSADAPAPAAHTEPTTLAPPPAPTTPALALKPPLIDLGQPDTNTAIVVAPFEVPPPPPLKLQGILYNPGNPSAVLNGRTLYVGDRVNGFRVLAITPQSVTLASATATNVLSLSE